MTATQRLNVLSLHGVSGSGKDTLADIIHPVADQSSYRLSFGYYLRTDVCLSLSIYSPPENEREVVPGTGMTFKEHMVRVGRQMALRDPLRYVRMVERELDELSEFSPLDRLVVCTDCRRPAEFRMLLDHPSINLWAVRLPTREGLRPMPLDHLLDDYRGIKQLMSGTPADYLEQVMDHLIRTQPIN